jgi:ABC-type glycerol-3-phosphate transport system permease component
MKKPGALKSLPLSLNLALLAMVVVCLFPLYWSLNSSFKGDAELFDSSPSLALRHPTLDNYRVAFSVEGGSEFPRYFLNSFVVSGGSVLLQLLVGSMAGYAFARIRFRGRDLIFYTMVLIMFVPRVGGLMATYELMDFLHLRNSHLGLILLFASSVSMALFVLRQAFLAVPRELEEAAIIDGAGVWQVFIRIAVPMAQGALVIVGTLAFLGAWGDYLTTYTMLDEQKLFTVSIAVRQIVTPPTSMEGNSSGYGVDNAIFILSSIPVILVYVLAQKWFVRGMREGIIKI